MMKRLFLVLGILLVSACGTHVRATDITVSATQVPYSNIQNLPSIVTGTAIVGNGSATVTSSAEFRSAWLNVGGFIIELDGTNYYVQNVSSTSSLTLTSVYTGNSGPGGAVTFRVFPFIYLQVYANRPYTPLGDTTVVQPGTPGSSAFFKRTAVSVINTNGQWNLHIPPVVLKATTDTANPGERNTRLTAVFYRTDGSRIAPYACFDNFRLPTSTPTSWTDICAYNTTTTILPTDTQTYTANQIDAMLPNCSAGQMVYFAATGQVTSCLSIGSGLSLNSGVLSASGGGGGGSSIWSDLLAPTQALTLNHAAYKTTFNWNSTSGAQDLMTLQSGSNDTGSGVVLLVQTQGSGTNKAPFRVNAKGNPAIVVNVNGQTHLGTDGSAYDSQFTVTNAASAGSTATAILTHSLTAANTAGGNAVTLTINDNATNAHSGLYGINLTYSKNGVQSSTPARLLQINPAAIQENQSSIHSIYLRTPGVLAGKTLTNWYGLYIQYVALGGTTTNKNAIYVESGAGSSTFNDTTINGRIIGTYSDSELTNKAFSVIGTLTGSNSQLPPYYNNELTFIDESTAGATVSQRAALRVRYLRTTNDINDAAGGIVSQASFTGSTLTSTLYGFRSRPDANGTAAGSVGFYAEANFGLGTITSEKGFISDPGLLNGFGTTTPSAVLHVSGSTRFDLGSDATGDTIYRSAGGGLSRLPIGSSGTFYKSTGSAPSWANLVDADIPDTITLTNITQITNRAISDTTGTLAVNRGGTGTASTPTDGQLLIGKTDGTYQLATLTAGSNVTITNASGSITIAAAGGGGGGSTIWSDLTAPGANLSLSHGTNTTTFEWGSNTSTSNLFTIKTNAGGDSGASGYLLSLETPGTSAKSPLRVVDGSTTVFEINGSGQIKANVGSDATGDTLYRASGGELARLGIGASGTFYKSTGTAPSWANLVDADIPDTITLTNITQITNRAITDTTGTLGVSRGGTGADLSATGGANQFVKQSSAGAVFTVGTIADADVPNTITLDNLTQITTRAISDTTGTLAVNRGGTGVTGAPSNGQLLIGNGTGYTQAAISVGTGISITNGAGSITIATSGTGGAKWNALTAPDGNLSLSHAANKTTFTWNAATSTNDLFVITNSSNDTGTGYLTSIETPGSTNAKDPFRVRTRGAHTFQVTNEGEVTQVVSTTATGKDLRGFISSVTHNSAVASGISRAVGGVFQATISSDANQATVEGVKGAANSGSGGLGGITDFRAVNGESNHDSDGTVTNLEGVRGYVSASAAGSATMVKVLSSSFSWSASGTATAVYGLHVSGARTLGTVTTFEGVHIAAPTGTIGTKRGLVVESGAGNSGFGTATPSAVLHVSGSTRLDLGSDAEGDTLYRSAGGDLSRLAIGASGTFYKSTGTAPSWAALVDADIPDTITLTNITQITNRAISDTTGTLAVNRGGTALTSTPTNGQLLIGNGTNYTLATITAGSGISVTNGAGSITIANTAAGVAGSNTQIQYNNSGAFGASANFTWDNSTSVLAIAGRQTTTVTGTSPATTITKTLSSGSALSGADYGLRVNYTDSATTSGSTGKRGMSMVYTRASGASTSSSAADYAFEIYPTVDSDTSATLRGVDITGPILGTNVDMTGGWVGINLSARTLGSGATLSSNYAIITAANAGDTGLGITAPTAQLHVKSDSNSKVGFKVDSGTTPSVDVFQVLVNGSSKLSVDSTGKTVATQASIGTGDGSGTGVPSGVTTPTALYVADGTSSTPSTSASPAVSIMRRWNATSVAGSGAGMTIHVTNDKVNQSTMEVLSVWSRTNQAVNGDRIGISSRMVSEVKGTGTSDFAIWGIVQKSARVDSSANEMSIDNQYMRTITAATNSVPIAITVSVAHDLSTGDEVAIQGVGGNTAANSLLWTVTVTGATTFTLDGSVGNGSYTSGGSVYLHSARDYGTAGNRGIAIAAMTGANSSYGNPTVGIVVGSGDPTRSKYWTGIDIRPDSIATQTHQAIRIPNADYLTSWNAAASSTYKLLGLSSGDKVHIDPDGRTIQAGTGPTVLTDAAGKILSSALNTVAVAQGGTGQTTTNFARVYNSSALSIGSGADTLLTFNSEHWDSNNLHDTGSNTSRLTAPVDGTYVITAHVAWASNTTGARYMYIRANGGTVIALEKVGVSGQGGLDDWMSIATTYRLSAGGYVEVVVFQNSGGNLNVLSAGNHSPEFSMVRVSD